MRNGYTPEMNIVIAAYKNNEKVESYILLRALADASRIFCFHNIGNAWDAMVGNSKPDDNNIVYKQMQAFNEACIM